MDGSLLHRPGGYRLISNLIDARTGEVLFSRSSDFAAEEELPVSVRELSRRLLGFLQLETEALAGSERADSISERLAKLLPEAVLHQSHQGSAA